MTSLDREYTLRGFRNVNEFEQAIDSLWSDPAVQAELKTLDVYGGITERRDAITITRAAMGIDPAASAIIVAFAPVAAKVVVDIWDKIIIPKIERKFGKDAVRPAERQSPE